MAAQRRQCKGRSLSLFFPQAARADTWPVVELPAYREIETGARLRFLGKLQNAAIRYSANRQRVAELSEVRPPPPQKPPRAAPHKVAPLFKSTYCWPRRQLMKPFHSRVPVPRRSNWKRPTARTDFRLREQPIPLVAGLAIGRCSVWPQGSGFACEKAASCPDLARRRIPQPAGIVRFRKPQPPPPASTRFDPGLPGRR